MGKDFSPSRWNLQPTRKEWCPFVSASPGCDNSVDGAQYEGMTPCAKGALDPAWAAAPTGSRTAGVTSMLPARGQHGRPHLCAAEISPHSSRNRIALLKDRALVGIFAPRTLANTCPVARLPAARGTQEISAQIAVDGTGWGRLVGRKSDDARRLRCVLQPALRRGVDRRPSAPSLSPTSSRTPAAGGRYAGTQLFPTSPLQRHWRRGYRPRESFSAACCQHGADERTRAWQFVTDFSTRSLASRPLPQWAGLSPYGGQESVVEDMQTCIQMVTRKSPVRPFSFFRAAVDGSPSSS